MGFVVIQNGKVFAPQASGTVSLLIAGEKIFHVGTMNLAPLEAAHLVDDVIDATGCVVLPGLIDPHQHLIGAGGEDGFTSRLPEIPLEQIVSAGITTVVGLLGTDTVTRNPSCLYAKVQQLNQEGLTARMYTGGFQLPARTLTGSVIDDLVMIEPIIGTGEIALSDSRWLDPLPHALAEVISQTHLGGRMSGKAGVTHFHIGELPRRLNLLSEVMDTYALTPDALYITHITRSRELLEDAIALAKRGVYVDMDAVDQNVDEYLKTYLEKGGDPARLTVSSDSYTPGGSPEKFLAALTACLKHEQLTMDQVLPCFTRNTAQVLKLPYKGQLRPGWDADVLILREGTWEVRHVFGRGRQFIRDGQLTVQSRQHELLREGQP